MEPSVLPTDSDIGGSAPRVAIDDDDGRPAWNPLMGGPLVPGFLAWDRFSVARHREIWLCWSVDLWAPAVVKLVRPEWSPQWKESLGREARALGAVAHPAVPRLLADGRQNAVPYIAVEYLDGRSLDECVAIDGLFPAGDVARLGVLVFGALAALHATGNGHLDISPGNVLLVDGRPRLIDLGASRLLGSQLRPGEALGTAGFQATEIVGRPGGQVTPAMDVFSLGATLLTALDPASVGADQVADRLAALTDDDPGRRPGIEQAMSSLAKAAGSRLTRPWPGFAERHLPPAPRRRRAPRARLSSVPAG